MSHLPAPFFYASHAFSPSGTHLIGLCSTDELEAKLERLSTYCEHLSLPMSSLLIEFDIGVSLHGIAQNTTHGEFFRYAKIVLNNIRMGDVAFHYERNQLLVVFPGANEVDVTRIIHKLMKTYEHEYPVIAQQLYYAVAERHFYESLDEWLLRTENVLDSMTSERHDLDRFALLKAV